MAAKKNIEKKPSITHHQRNTIPNNEIAVFKDNCN